MATAIPTVSRRLVTALASRTAHTYQTPCLSRGFADKATLDRLLGENFSPESIGRIMRAEEYTKFKWAIEFRLHNNIHTAIRGDFWAMTAANGEHDHDLTNEQ